jgi:hypothetical protein
MDLVKYRGFPGNSFNDNFYVLPYFQSNTRIINEI